MKTLRLFFHGVASMVYQFAIVKALAPYYGTSLHTWAITIAGFLLAYSLGGFVGGALARQPGRWRRWIIATAVVFVCATVLSTLLLEIFALAPFYVGLSASVAVLCLLPITMMTGLLPIHLASIKATPDVQSTTYGWIGIGNITGTLIAPFLLLPFLGLTLTMIVCAVVVILVCILWFKSSCNGFVPAPLYALIALPIASFALTPGRDGLLYSAHDAFGWIGVADRGQYRVVLHRYLNRIGSVESVVKRDNPSEPLSYAGDMFRLAEQACDRPTNILQIGLGAGGNNHYIARFHPDASLVSVEINPTMLKVAQTYFGLPKAPAHKVVIDDARHYVRSLSKSYDWVILDAFLGSYPPDHLRTVEFYRLLAQKVSDSGILMVNHVTLHSDHEREIAGIVAAFPFVYRKAANALQEVVIASKRPLPCFDKLQDVRLAQPGVLYFSDEYSIIPAAKRT